MPGGLSAPIREGTVPPSVGEEDRPVLIPSPVLAPQRPQPAWGGRGQPREAGVWIAQAQGLPFPVVTKSLRDTSHVTPSHSRAEGLASYQSHCLHTDSWRPKHGCHHASAS